jgi:uncharacterized protein (DUF2267 family)
VRGAYYDQFQPTVEPLDYRTVDEFLDVVELGLDGVADIVSAEDAAIAVFRVLDHYVDPGQVEKVREALPAEIRTLWSDGTSAIGSAA